MTPMTKDREPLVNDAQMFGMVQIDYPCFRSPLDSEALRIRDMQHEAAMALGKRLRGHYEADRAKLLELVRQAIEIMKGKDMHDGQCRYGIDPGAPCTCRITAFLSRCKEVVPDLLVDGGDNPLPPSPTEP